MMNDSDRSPYLLESPPTSPGRAFLARAFAHWCALEHGFSGEEIAAALAGDPDVDPAVTRRIENATRLMGEVLAAGRMRAWARPKGGGVPEPMDPSLWELDDWRHRLATSAVALANPFDPEAASSHYVFVDVDDFNAMIEEAFAEARPGSRPAPRPAREPSGTRVGENPKEDGGAATQAGELDRHLRLADVLRATGFSRSTLYDRIAQRRFPAQIGMEGNIASWRESEVREWLANPK